MEKTWSTEIAGEELCFETGKYAQQANGSVMASYGDTTILVTATMEEPREGIDYLPLMVNYEERVYAIGEIPGSITRREGKPRDEATLFARLIDRPLRPLFPQSLRHDIQVIATVLSVDDDCAPEIVAMNGASAALMISDIPFDGPIAGVKMGLVDDELIVNPDDEQCEKSELDLMVAGSEDAVMMVEGNAQELSEEMVVEAIDTAHEHIKEIVKLQKEMAAEIGQEEMEVDPPELPDELKDKVEELGSEKMKEAAFTKKKLEREENMDAAREEIMGELAEELDEETFSEYENMLEDELDDLAKKLVRREIIENGKRPDGRDLDEVRPIESDVGFVPKVHGCGMFKRGETQTLSVLTLGASSDEQILFGLGEEETKGFLHHYNFPPYSVGETNPLRGPGRREIGHGALGEKALSPVLPDEIDFPYTIRLVSEVLESNGSTSQASICSSCLAMMDGGVPLKSPVAGIAMGLMKEGDDIAILSDIQGLEDFFGDMDFKVAGTREGITALQMDIKVSGISKEIMKKALNQAREGRLHILDRMSEVIAEPRSELSPHAPRMITLEIDPDKIRHVIGPGGKMINKIIDKTGAQIDIEDDGTVYILSEDQEGGEEARNMIEELTREVVVGEIYTGKVKKIVNFGAFAEIVPGREGLIHISELADYHVNEVEDILEVGDEVPVKVTEIDDQDRLNLSRIQAIKEMDEEEKEKYDL
ncbi:polyribonucleotide nucleotidyltransferase [Halarsenatibacter silvermanii]|uniref:Polyribonucleotide nucleotidyltransferase n=1 Tax=Halarsenatibacter silvermanii TaxID=321763 RepID=A0A1G9LJ72_9FIRM|nr:polyribonucleotide nucleotidyltransferase [Halarsenatibacter silvermanii]SDL61595.1 polyribonucleotide nucleotidyltransferase [Halarsenatibacter silvermanii]